MKKGKVIGMKAMETFYKLEDAIDFKSSLDYDAKPEIVKTMDEDVNETVWIVYYNPPRLK